MAVLTRHAAAPISIASIACDGFPIPASTIIGISSSWIIISISSLVLRPLLLPIGAPSGIIAAAPASISLLPA